MKKKKFKHRNFAQKCFMAHSLLNTTAWPLTQEILSYLQQPLHNYCAEVVV